MPRAKKPKQVFMVEDCSNAPGRVYAIFDDQETAEWFAEALENSWRSCQVVPRTLFYGQPPALDYNE